MPRGFRHPSTVHASAHARPGAGEPSAAEAAAADRLLDGLIDQLGGLTPAEAAAALSQPPGPGGRLPVLEKACLRKLNQPGLTRREGRIVERVLDALEAA